jgi:hypothetical protein
MNEQRTITFVRRPQSYMTTWKIEQIIDHDHFVIMGTRGKCSSTKIACNSCENKLNRVPWVSECASDLFVCDHHTEAHQSQHENNS